MRRLEPILAALIAGLVYTGCAFLFHCDPSPPYAYFDKLAESLVQGHLYLLDPPRTHDLTLFDGKWYVPFPPLPALLMAPLVAFGIAVKPLWFSIGVAAVNVGLLYALLQVMQSWDGGPRRRGAIVALTLLFAFGTVHWYVALSGAVWFLAHICTVTGIVAAAWLAARGSSPWLVGLALGAAVLGRPHVVLAWPFLVGLELQRQRSATPPGQPLQGRPIVRWCAVSLVPVAQAMLALMAYNNLRFGNPLDFGYVHQNVDSGLYAQLSSSGQFGLRYLRTNTEVALAALPVWDANVEAVRPDTRGMSIFLTTPALFFLFTVLPRRYWQVGAWLAILLILAPLLTYYNTGWRQFGYRFSLDFSIPAIALLAPAANRRDGGLFIVMIVLSVAINLWGTWWWLTVPH